MSNLSIGLVASPSEECEQMVQLLKGAGLEIRYHIAPAEIDNQHTEDTQLSVWLLNVNDDDWHDNIDLLLDESDASIYFNEPGTLTKQAHPEFWCRSLVRRLYEITGLTAEAAAEIVNTSDTKDTESNSSNGEIAFEPIDDLGSALEDLEVSSIELPSEVVADLVSQLESISPELETDMDELPIDSEVSLENINLDSEPEIDELSQSVLEVDESNIENESLDDIDFSSNNVPILESAREDLSSILESDFSLTEDIDNSEEDHENFESIPASEGSRAPSTLALDNQQDRPIEIEQTDESGLSLEAMIDPINEIESQSDEAQPVRPQGMANFLMSEYDPDESAEENISLDDYQEGGTRESEGLALESIKSVEEAPITGKSVFIEEEAEVPAESVSSEPVDVSEQDLSGLALESHEEELPTGKAVFFEEEIELEEDSTEIEAEGGPNTDEEILGLTLELNGNEPPTGKAVFIEHEPSESDESATGEIQNETENAIADLDDGGLSLESNGSQPTTGKAEFLVDEEETDDTEGLVETFEIPMLEETVMDMDFEETSGNYQQENSMIPCWVIGASLGGPAAVKRFFQSLPADINACFVVVQHIDESFLPVMAEILSNNSQFEVKVANGSNSMQAGKVYLAPLKGKITFLQDGSMLVDHSQKWTEPYSPCINDVVSSLASIYGDLGGSIIFSGMGEDGLNGCEKLAAVGGAVWAQSTETCANSSMPNAVINSDLASVVAAPEMLADRLVKTLSEAVYG